MTKAYIWRLNEASQFQMFIVPTILHDTLYFKGTGKLSQYNVESNFQVQDVQPTTNTQQKYCEPFDIYAPMRDLFFVLMHAR